MIYDKCQILANGFRKRQKFAEALFYDDLKKQFSQECGAKKFETNGD
jgi:hypothetical protein